MTKEVKKKMPFPLRVIHWTMPKLEKIAPNVAGKWAWKLFFTPFRFPIPKKEQAVGDTANKFTFEAQGYTIQGYEWGSGDKTIFLLHGWSGRATQWMNFIKPLNDNGYKVVAIDGPAHGASSGKMTEIMKYQNILQEALRLYPEIDTMITHSFGGAATMFGFQNGLKLKRFVNIGTPTDADYIVTDFLRRINASAKSGERFKQRVLKNFGNPFEYYSVKETIKFADNTDILMIHDRLDKEVPVKHSLDVHEANPKTQLVITEGLGHMRILKDDGVIAKAIEFINEPVAV
jgi:pimeloyl-ACP methyl ester carboxylesterase